MIIKLHDSTLISHRVTGTPVLSKRVEDLKYEKKLSKHFGRGGRGLLRAQSNAIAYFTLPSLRSQ